MGKEKKSWWERYWEDCAPVLVLTDIRPECLTDKAKIKYKDELEHFKEEKEKK